MNISEIIPRHSLLFAPMEGITDGPYREVITSNFSGWQRTSCDFLRVPAVGKISEKRIIEHFGKDQYEDQGQRDGTAYQILTAPGALTSETVKKINGLGFKHLDLNLGCPSKKVNSHKGGAYLLSDLDNLAKILTEIRENFSGLFTVKIRTGYRNADNFLDLLKLFEDQGVEAVTIHARTRDQLYKGQADWNFIKLAAESTSLPVIGNGDIWTEQDIQSLFKETNCYAVMVGRGALKTPWLGKLHEMDERGHRLDDQQKKKLRVGNIKVYLRSLEQAYTQKGWSDQHLLRRFKGLIRYLFEDFEDGGALRSSLLRTKDYQIFKSKIESLKVQ